MSINLKFRRGQRVVVPSYAPHGPSVSYGSVTNPNLDYRGCVRVRLDKQQPFETGCAFMPDQVSPAPDDRTQYELRHYSLFHLSHNEVAALRMALEHVNVRDDTLTDNIVQKLLNKLPELP